MSRFISAGTQFPRCARSSSLIPWSRSAGEAGGGGAGNGDCAGFCAALERMSFLLVRSKPMLDLSYLAVGTLLVLACWWLAKACERL